MAYVYRHIRVDKNEPFYIGIGSDHTYRRAHTHNNRNRYWRNIVAKTAYEVEIIFDDVDKDFARNKEIEFIKLYGRKDLKSGTLVNCTDGGEGMKGWSESQLAVFKEKRKGYKASPETIKKLSESHMGHKASPETIEKMRRSKKDQIITKETREKMAAKLRGRPLPEWQRKILSESAKKRGINRAVAIYQLDMAGGIIKEYNTIRSAAKELNVQEGNIHKVMVGKRPHTGGFKFRYKNK